jgi:AcrR family transcriptional regulator
LEKDRKQQIIKVAEKRFVKHGFHKTTLDEVARDLRISKSTLYHYFTSKEDLYFTTLRWQVDQYISKIDELLKAELPLKEKINEYLKYKETVFENFKLILSLFIQFMNETQFEEENIILQELYSREENSLKESLTSIVFKETDLNFTFHSYFVQYTWGLVLNKRITSTMPGVPSVNADLINFIIDNK